MARKPLTRTQRIARWFASSAGAKLTHRLPGLAVFATGAYISYWHIVSVVSSERERTDSALLYPVIIDMTIVVAARYITRARTWIGRIIAVLAFTCGAGYTLYCNWLAAAPTVTGRILGVAPGVMVILTAGALHWGEMRPRRKAPAKAPQKSVEATASPNGYQRVRELSTIA